MTDTITPNQPAVREVAGREVPAAGTYTLDPSHSTVEFVVKHLMISKVRGRFSDVAAKITIAEVPEQSHVEVTIGAASVSTGDAKRDEHLRSADFFDVEQHPNLTFTSTKVEPVRNDRWEVTGDLTVLGVTKPVVLEVEFSGAGQTPWGSTAIGFSASTEIDREEWGLTWNAALETGGVVVGKKVRIELEVEATRDQ
ncbi:MAG TPA: YceI family protein [Acidimicrobiales bacterium]|nr:YceI family protein [Acidimicrobiales bacterium]